MEVELVPAQKGKDFDNVADAGAWSIDLEGSGCKIEQKKGVVAKADK